MEKEILEEIEKECKTWKERVLVSLFPKLFVNIYKEGIRQGFKWSNRTVH